MALSAPTLAFPANGGGGGVLVVVRCIPSSYTTSALRAFFSTAVERSAFIVFHFRGRKGADLVVTAASDAGSSGGRGGKQHTAAEDAGSGAAVGSSNGPPTAAAVASGGLSTAAAGSLDGPPADAHTQCCVVRVAAAHAAWFLRTYNGKPWTDADGKFVPGAACQLHRLPPDAVVPAPAPPTAAPPYEPRGVRRARLKGAVGWQGGRRRHSAAAAAGTTGAGAAAAGGGGGAAAGGSVAVCSLQELHPPVALPAGNVGTPTAVIKQLLRECRLPTAALKSLGVDFVHRRAPTRKYGAVAYRYPEVPAHTPCQPPGTSSATTAPAPPRVGPPPQPRVGPPPRASSAAATARRQRYETAADRAAAGGGSDTDGGDRSAEEWDRHAAWHADQLAKHTFRTHTEEREEYVFESAVHNPWDKGDNSGLVLYTDAVKHEAARGGFDEKTVDDFDVDARGLDERDVYGRGGVPGAVLEAAADFRQQPGGAAAAGDDEYAGGGGGDGTVDGRNGYFSVADRRLCGDHVADCDAPGDDPLLLPAKRRRRRRNGRAVGPGEAMARQLLERHGWQPGRGMGKALQGAAEPIVPEHRPRREGLGWEDVKAAHAQERHRAKVAARAAARGHARIGTVVDHQQALAAASAAKAADTHGVFQGTTEAERLGFVEWQAAPPSPPPTDK